MASPAASAATCQRMRPLPTVTNRYQPLPTAAMHSATKKRRKIQILWFEYGQPSLLQSAKVNRYHCVSLSLSLQSAPGGLRRRTPHGAKKEKKNDFTARARTVLPVPGGLRKRTPHAAKKKGKKLKEKNITARARTVLPVPGGPYKRTPRGGSMPSVSNLPVFSFVCVVILHLYLCHDVILLLSCSARRL